MDPTSLNLRHLKAMAAIAATGSVSAAARAINLTQPAITQGIAKLERQIGLPLFDRRPGGMVATDAAWVLAPRAEAALRLIDSPRVTGAQMRAFMAVARQGSYAAAAVVTGTREASLHRAVGDLSVALGYPLVERRGRGIVLTARGRQAARRFRLAEAELRSALAEMAALRGADVGRIALGAMPLSRARLLPRAIAAFYAAHGEADVRILEGAYAELIGPLRDGEIDFMVGALRDAAAGEDLVQTPLFVDRPVVLARAAHPLETRPGPPTAGELARYPWVLPPEGTPLRTQWRQIFEAAGGEPPRVAIECGSVIIIRQLLIDTDFLTLLSPDQVALELEAGWLRRVGPAPGDPSRTIGLTARSDWRPTRLQQDFLAALHREAGAMSEPTLSKNQ